MSTQWAEIVAKQLGHLGALYMRQGERKQVDTVSPHQVSIFIFCDLWFPISLGFVSVLLRLSIRVSLLCLLSHLLHYQCFWHLNSYKCHKNLGCKWAKGCITTRGGLMRAFVTFSSCLVCRKHPFIYRHSISLSCYVDFPGLLTELKVSSSYSAWLMLCLSHWASSL